MTRASVPTRRALLQASGLFRSYADVTAVAEVELDLTPGEIHALVGLNGAGKTTLMRLLLGMVRPDKGQLALFGRRLVDAGAAEWARVGHLIETPFAYPELTVAENVVASARLHGLSRAAATEAAASTVSTLALTPWVHRRASTVSLGNRQRLGLACALAHRPDVLVLDEPPGHWGASRNRRRHPDRHHHRRWRLVSLGGSRPVVRPRRFRAGSRRQRLAATAYVPGRRCRAGAVGAMVATV